MAGEDEVVDVVEVEVEEGVEAEVEAEAGEIPSRNSKRMKGSNRKLYKINNQIIKK